MKARDSVVIVNNGEICYVAITQGFKMDTDFIQVKVILSSNELKIKHADIFVVHIKSFITPTTVEIETLNQIKSFNTFRNIYPEYFI